MLSERTVALSADPDLFPYPSVLPFCPSEVYPELEGKISVGREQNRIYRLLRETMMNLGMDSERWGTVSWNPLGEIIQPGQHIVVKPNFVRHLHLGNGDYRAVVTHGSVIRAVLDYAGLALRGEGDIVVGDAPVQSADFDKIIERIGLKEI